MRSQILAIFVIFVMLAAASCTRRSNDPRGSGETTASAGPAATLAPFALGYHAREQGAEKDIARAQAQVRSAPDQVASYVALAQAFVVRRRETADSTYLAYAKDATAAALRLAPRDPGALASEIMIEFDAHRFAEAARLARQVIDIDPASATGYLLLSDARLELGAYDEAVAALQQAMDRAPDLRSFSRAAHLRWLANDVDGAFQAMTDAINASSRSPEPIAWCYVDTGMMLWHAGKLDTAARAAERALALVPGYAPALSLQARILAGQGKDQQALSKLEEVIARAPTAEVLLRAGELAAGLGRASDADRWIAVAEKLASHDPIPVALFHARRAEKADHALTLAEKALGERATIYSHDALALALLRKGRPGEASQAISKALALGTPDPTLLLHRSLIEIALGQHDRARASARAAKAMNPHADPLLVAEIERTLGHASSKRIAHASRVARPAAL